jgi:transposase, IS30 family
LQRYRRVSFAQRCQIVALIENEISICKVALQLNLHRSTIYRELKRNRLSPGLYRARHAHAFARWRRLKFCKKKRLGFDQQTERALKAEFSPEQIAGRFKRQSHQSIYDEINFHRPELRRFLPRFGKRRGRGRKGRHPHRERPEWMLPISARPQSVSERKELGHWERDTMYLKDRKMLLVCVERKSRFVKIEKMNQRSFKNLPQQTLRMISVRKPLSVTNDNGAEFMGNYPMKLPTYYCDPYSPQQRGSIENMIGVIRRDLTRQTNINTLSKRDLKKIQNKLNHRPRKCLGFKTPYEVMFNENVALAV